MLTKEALLDIIRLCDEGIALAKPFFDRHEDLIVPDSCKEAYAELQGRIMSLMIKRHTAQVELLITYGVLVD